MCVQVHQEYVHKHSISTNVSLPCSLHLSPIAFLNSSLFSLIAHLIYLFFSKSWYKRQIKIVHIWETWLEYRKELRSNYKTIKIQSLLQFSFDFVFVKRTWMINVLSMFQVHGTGLLPFGHLISLDSLLRRWGLKCKSVSLK